jgi:hypothetical protein
MKDIKLDVLYIWSHACYFNLFSKEEDTAKDC